MFGQSLALAALTIFWYMLVMYIIALIRRDTGIATLAWGPGVLIAALAVLWWHEPVGLRPLLVTVLVAIWAVRLKLHILLRDWGRRRVGGYASWRKKWGQWWPLKSFFSIFLLRGALLLLVASPVLWINTYGGPRLGWLDWVGLGVWFVGAFFEAIGDHQLVRFQKNPANHGRVLQSGLWRYTRHPNYFGEVTQWWGIWLIALSVGQGWVTVVGPLTITLLIFKFSGIPLVEARYKNNAAYRAYAQRTNLFFPGLQKRTP